MMRLQMLLLFFFCLFLGLLIHLLFDNQEAIAEEEEEKEPPLSFTLEIPSEFQDHGFREDHKHYRALMLSVDYGMEALSNLTTPNHQAYCKRHSIKYHLVGVDEIDRNYETAWSKLASIREALIDGWNWVIWVDADAIFTNISHDILEHVDHHHDLFMSKDFNGLNSGVMIIRNTAWASMYLEFLYSLRNKWPSGLNPCFRYEQRGFALTYNDICFSKKNPNWGPFPHYQNVRRRIKLIDTHNFNSYPCKSPKCKPNKWRVGDTIFHAAGLNHSEKLFYIKAKLKRKPT